MFAIAFMSLLAALPLPELEQEGRERWFQATIVRSALEPCKVAVPLQADAFEQHVGRWLRENDTMIRRGEASFRAEAGEAFQPEAFDFEGAQRQFTALLRDYPEERKRTWCDEQLQMRPDPGG